MKNLLFKITGILLFLLLIATSSQIRIGQIIGDTGGAPTLKQELASRLTRTQSDARYPLKDSVITDAELAANSESLWTNVYSRTQIDSMKVFGRSFANSLRAMGATFKTVTIGAQAAGFNGACPLTDGQISFVKLETVPYAQTLSSVKFMLQTAGNYTADQENRVFLANLVGTTYTIVAASTNDTDEPNLFEATANTVISKDFTTPYSAAANEQLFVGFIYNNSAQTTAPLVYGVNNSNAGFNNPTLWGISSYVAGRITAAGNNTLPASVTVANCTQTAYHYLVTVF